MAKFKVHTGEMEIEIVKLIGYRTHMVVPNVSWGLGLNHECDLLVLDQKNRFTEIEIKISAADLKKDFGKWHSHKSSYISRLVYALPDWLYETHGDMIPPSCGVILVSDIGRTKKWLTATWARQCKHSRFTKPVPDHMLKKFFHLGSMRIWTLKTKLQQTTNNYNELVKKHVQGKASGCA